MNLKKERKKKESLDTTRIIDRFLTGLPQKCKAEGEASPNMLPIRRFYCKNKGGA